MFNVIHRTVGHHQALYCPHSGIFSSEVISYANADLFNLSKDRSIGDKRCQGNAMKV